MEKPHWYQVSLRTHLEITTLVAAILAFAYQRGGSVGRFQLVNGTTPGSGQTTFVVDTATGKVWTHEYDSTWSPNTPPGIGR
jgi:hypothetical protein